VTDAEVGKTGVIFFNGCGIAWLITRVNWPFRLTRKFDEPKGRKTFLSDVCQQNHCVIGE
jgi:hypothetical protein